LSSFRFRDLQNYTTLKPMTLLSFK